jgi:hypothetical protein
VYAKKFRTAIPFIWWWRDIHVFIAKGNKSCGKLTFR